ncbi:MAG: hypothetical protein AAF936_15535 [Pseudomonadota bacterium]
MSGSGINYQGDNPTQAFQEAAAHTSKPKAKHAPPFSLRLTFDERERLRREAGSRSLGAYIRHRLFGDEASPRKFKRRKPGPDHAQLGRALGILGQSRLTANMNQIAKAANMGALPVTPELSDELHEACADIQAMRHALIAALGIKPEDGS